MKYFYDVTMSVIGEVVSNEPLDKASVIEAFCEQRGISELGFSTFEVEERAFDN